MRWTIEFAPSAARSFRSLPRDAQRAIAERLAHLESAGPPPLAPAAEDENDVIPVPAGDHVLLCVVRPGPVLLVAAVESADDSLAAAGARAARPALQRALGTTGGDRDDVVWLRRPGGRLPAVHRMPSPLGIMDLWIEVRRAARALSRQPGISVLAAAALALGIGLPTAMFSFLDATFLRGLPVDEPAEVMHIERRPAGASGEGWGAYAQDYAAWREQQRSFELLAAFTGETVTLRSESGADRWSAARLTPEAFELLGESAMLGRVFQPDDARPGAAPVVLVGDRLWRDRLDADPSAVGGTVYVDGVARTVVGVMPPAFRFPNDADIWLPLSAAAAGAPAAGDPTYNVMGRLRDGVSERAAQAEFDVIAAQMAERYPATHEGYGIVVRPITVRFMGETPVRTMYIMLGAVLLVLVIACANVANLLLVRAVHRLRDLAVRAALGASRGRLIVQLMMESLLLALAGGALGGVVAFGAVGALRRGLGDRMPFWVDIRLDTTALLFALALSFAAALLAGVLPALKATARDLAGTLHDEARGSTGLRIGRLMQGLVALEIALSLGLLVATGLLLRSVQRVQNVALGFTTENVFTGRLTLPDSYGDSARRSFYASVMEAVAANPGTQAVAFGSQLPATRSPTTRFAVEGVTYDDDDGLPRAHTAAVSERYFSTFGLAPVQGRDFGPQDSPDGLPVAIVNRRFVERHLSGRDPLGARIRMGGDDADGPWLTIVGVVPDLYMGALDALGDRNPAGVYLPLSQNPPASASIAVLARGEPLAVAPVVRGAAASADRDVPVYEVRTMTRLLADNSWFYGLGAGIMGVCGVAALLLAAIGLYGVIAFSVGRRTREIGIRMAMGARARDVLGLVLKRGMLQVGAGIVLGFGLAYVLGQGIASLLFDVSPTDPFIFGGVAAILAAIATGAMLIPATRAARLDPQTALRTE